LPLIRLEPPLEEFCEYPVFISEPQPAEKLPPEDEGKVFHTKEVEVCDRPPQGGRFYFSRKPDTCAPIRVDDGITIYVENDPEPVFSYDFASPNPPPYVLSTWVEIPRDKVEQMAGKTITVNLQDLHGLWFVSLYDIWLIWLEEPCPE
jgi:hypothetical protein